jgi:dGTPase
MDAMVVSFSRFMFQNFYWNPAVLRPNEEAVAMMRELFLHYLEHPDAMGRKARARIAGEGLRRTVCDYVSGFTDRYAIEEYARFGLGTRARPAGQARGGP